MVVEIIMEGGEHWDITDQKTSLAVNGKQPAEDQVLG
jgi:hypothetical protein